MRLDRPGYTPAFYNYAVDYVIQKFDSHDSYIGLPQNIKDFDPNIMRIPPYQRKIVWGKDELKDFIDSKSVLFGTVILASIDRSEPFVLLDGLQRFAIATAIINYIYSNILESKSIPNNVVSQFKLLKDAISGKKDIFKHNDMALKTYTRTGIISSYKELCDNVKSIIDKGIKDDQIEFIHKINKTFVNKQIAIDTYYGFANKGEFIQTFININSTGLDLSEVDLLRSAIIQQAELKEWDTGDMDQIENKFTDIFQSGEIKGAKVLGKNLYDAVSEDPQKVFTNWDGLKKEDVDDLLDFIEQMYDAAKKEDMNGKIANPYLYEIFQCGHLPFAITTWFFFKMLKSDKRNPDFLGGDFNTISDLHILLRVFYRRIIDGSIGRIGPIVTNFIQEKDMPKISKISQLVDKINPIEKDIHSAPDENWLKTNLKKANMSRIRRIFNACLLPDRNDDKNFEPLIYGARENHYIISHLIKKTRRDLNKEWYEQLDKIYNLFPVKTNINKKIKTLNCSEKLLEQAHNDPHSNEYVNWLITDHYKKYSNKTVDNKDVLVLESPECLVGSHNPNIGNERLTEIAQILNKKL